MACLDPRPFDLRRASELQKIIDSHEWELQHFDDFGESGVIVRYACIKCGKEWTTFLLDPGKVRRLGR
ncbi:MAG: hypothetical protein ACREBS_06265 [Nitrososphaerales archaeon]